MQVSLSKESFLRVRRLSEKKRKNEEAVPMEVLQTKYKIPYENLCQELKESQKQLRMEYMESIRVATYFISESVYMDLSNDDEWKKLLDKCSKLYENSDKLTMNLVQGFILTINNYVRSDCNGEQFR